MYKHKCSRKFTHKYICLLLTSLDLHAIDEPLDLEVRVVDGFKAALQMAALALNQVIHAAGRRDGLAVVVMMVTTPFPFPLSFYLPPFRCLSISLFFSLSLFFLSPFLLHSPFSLPLYF